MSARPSPARPAGDVVAAFCPRDPGEIIAAMQRGLFHAMRSRADGSWHLPTCRDASVNSRRYGCSEKCQTAQIAVEWAVTWLLAHRQPAPEQQMRMVVG